MKQIKAPRNISLWLSAAPFILAIISLFIAVFVWKAPIYLALMAGWIAALCIGIAHGFSVKALFKASYEGIRGTFIVVSILVLIGGVIAVWMASGTVAALIVYGIKLLNPQFLLVTAFLLTLGMSMLLGTSVGTLSTMGIALAGIGHAYGVPTGLMGGALISGAMIGDRTSPLSGTLHLLAAVTDSKVEQIFPRIVRSALPVMLLCIIVFGWMGLAKVDIHASVQTGMQQVEQLQTAFSLHWIAILPPLLVLLLAIMHIPIRLNLLLGMAVGGMLAIILQGRSVHETLYTLWNGYAVSTGNDSALLHGGGIWPMINVVLIILSAGALNGILEKSGMTANLIGGLLARIKHPPVLTVWSVLISILTGLVFCNQALMVIIPGRLLQPKYAELGIERVQLAGTIADSGVVFSALIPWNLHAVLCATAMGVATADYAPYAFFLWGLPLVTLLKAAATGFWLNRKPRWH